MSVAGPPAYRPLPIVADEGFPQSFRLALEERMYRVTLYVNASERRLDELAEDALLRLSEEPEEEIHLVVAVARESDLPEPLTIFKRKVVPGLDYDAGGELALRFDELTIARRNLNAPGPHGSSVRGGVAPTWAS